MINLRNVGELGFVVDLNLSKGNVLLREECRFLPSHSFAAFVVDLKELVDLLEG